jgi:hypothetical protein
MSPRNKLKVVPVASPWTALSERLTGDVIHDKRVILAFCSRYDVSEQTVRSRLKLYDASGRGQDRRKPPQAGRA